MVINKLPTKFKDSSSFSIPYLLGCISINRALGDLSLSVSLMPYSIFKRLDLVEFSLANISLQLADHCVKYPWVFRRMFPLRCAIFMCL